MISNRKLSSFRAVSLLVLIAIVFQTNLSRAETVVYDDDLWPAWTAWSWNGEFVFDYSDIVLAGEHSISAAAGPTGGFSLYSDTPFPEATEITFWLRGGASLLVSLSDDAGSFESEKLAVADIVETTPVGWVSVSVDISELGEYEWTQINFINGGVEDAAFLLDEIVLQGVDFSDPDETPDTVPPESYVYQDKLWPGWTSWSWGGEYDFEFTDLVHAGARSILATTEAYGAFSVHSQRTFYEATGVTFWLFGGSTLVFTIQGEISGLESDPIALADLVDTTSLQWTEINISFAELGDLQWTRLNLINNSEEEVTYLVDDIVLHGVDFPSPDDVPDDPPDSGIESYVFEDQLWPGWASWSWGGEYLFDQPGIAHTGSRSIVANAEAFGALSLHAEMSFAEATAMSFWLWGGSTLIISFQGDGDDYEADPVAVSDLATVSSDKWVSVRIELGDLEEHDWTRVNFMNDSEQDVSYLVDDIVLHGVDFPSPDDIPDPGSDAPSETSDGGDGQGSPDGDESTSGCLCQSANFTLRWPSLLLFALSMIGWRRRRSPLCST